MGKFGKASKMDWIGRVITTLVSLPLIFSAVGKFKGGPELTEGMAHLGLPIDLVMTLAVLESICIIIYLIPRTAVLGAILLTGYMGGAICTHLRVGEPVILQTAIGVLAWVGIYFREPRLRSLIPLRIG